MKHIRVSAAGMVIAIVATGAVTPAAHAQPAAMSFFVTSVGSGKGGNLGGLEGADAHCLALAKTAGSPLTNWRAYLSTTPQDGRPGVNARDRIGKGPWQNARGVVVATSIAALHSSAARINKKTALTEKGAVVSGTGDAENKHGILTGSDPQGNFSTKSEDTTCGNWTRNGDGAAIVGHHDRIGRRLSKRPDARMAGGRFASGTPDELSWNSLRSTNGCTPMQLKKSASAGLFYCFVAN